MPILRPLPLPFVQAYSTLSWVDAEVGLSWGLISARDVVSLARQPASTDAALPAFAAELASLSSDELDRVAPILMASPRPSAAEVHRAERKWVYLQLEWLWAHKASTSENLDAIEEVYRATGYPTDMSKLIRWMPAEPGEATGEDALLQHWLDYLRAHREEFGPGK